MTRRSLVCAGYVLAGALFAALCAGPASSQGDDTPHIALPDRARGEIVGDDLIVNGLPTRITHFEAIESSDEVVRHFRAQFGAEVTAPVLPGYRTIAARLGDYFCTVRIQDRPDGTVEGFVMTTRMTPHGASPARPRASNLTAMLPSESAVLSQVDSRDGGKMSTLMVAANRHNLAANTDHLKRAFADRGLVLEREQAVQVGRRDGRALWFKSAREEALVTVNDAGDYRTVVVNRLSVHP